MLARGVRSVYRQYAGPCTAETLHVVVQQSDTVPPLAVAHEIGGPPPSWRQPCPICCNRYVFVQPLG